jgi:hypothetical protein
MNVENNKHTLTQNAVDKFDPDTEFHIALGWLTALSVSIAAIATAA